MTRNPAKVEVIYRRVLTRAGPLGAAPWPVRTPARGSARAGSQAGVVHPVVVAGQRVLEAGRPSLFGVELRRVADVVLGPVDEHLPCRGVDPYDGVRREDHLAPG